MIKFIAQSENQMTFNFWLEDVNDASEMGPLGDRGGRVTHSDREPGIRRKDEVFGCTDFEKQTFSKSEARKSATRAKEREC